MCLTVTVTTGKSIVPLMAGKNAVWCPTDNKEYCALTSGKGIVPQLQEIVLCPGTKKSNVSQAQ
jgi:hypothetical protein